MNHGKIVNIYIFYEINKTFNRNCSPALENCLFGAAELTKHPDIDQYKYSGSDLIEKDFPHLVMKLIEM